MNRKRGLAATSARPLAEVEVDQKFDFRRHWNAILVRLWAPLVAAAIGIALGYLLALGGNQVYTAEALIYLGQPLSPSGAAPVQSLATDSTTVGEIARAPWALKEAARASGLPFVRLRDSVSTQPVGAATRNGAPVGQTPLVRISVTGNAPRKVALAANTLATRVVKSVSGYADVKIRSFTRRLDGESRMLASLDRRIDVLNAALGNASGRPALGQLVLISQVDAAEQRRGQLVDQQSETQQLLALAENVERSRVVSPAVAVNTTGKSVRNSMIIGAAIGALLGSLAAIFWEPISTRLNRRPGTVG